MWHTPPHSFATISAQLGWLESIDWMQAHSDELKQWARQIVQCGEYDRVLLLGMGGASLAASVFASLFKPAHGYLPLNVLDTSHPDEIARRARGDLRRCLFIVSSKSGTTCETVALYRYFRARLATQCAHPETHFVLITDADSALHQLGQTAQFNQVFINPSDIGGRYSALSYFGMLPAALLGVEIDTVLTHAQHFCATTQSDHPAENAALALAMLLARGVLKGNDKLIVRLPPPLLTFGMWIEQLIAESSGKDGTGLVPIVVADDMNFCPTGDDQITIRIACGTADFANRKNVGAENVTEESDYTLWLEDAHHIGAEFFRWQMATALAASSLRINPFDQPDVEHSKRNTRLILQGRSRLHAPCYSGEYYDLHAHNAGHSNTDVLADFCHTLVAKSYLGLLAYLPEDAHTMALLQSLREQILGKFNIVSTLGIGPRYLHSTGQLHKGGPPSGRFIQLVAAVQQDLAVPQSEYTFGQLCRAQADGDFLALLRTDNVVLRVCLKADKIRSLAVFVSDLLGNE